MIKEWIDALKSIRSDRTVIPSEYNISEFDKIHIEDCWSKVLGRKLNAEEIIESENEIFRSPIQRKQKNYNSTYGLSKISISQITLCEFLLKIIFIFVFEVNINVFYKIIFIFKVFIFFRK